MAFCPHCGTSLPKGGGPCEGCGRTPPAEVAKPKGRFKGTMLTGGNPLLGAAKKSSSSQNLAAAKALEQVATVRPVPAPPPPLGAHPSGDRPPPKKKQGTMLGVGIQEATDTVQAPTSPPPGQAPAASPRAAAGNAVEPRGSSSAAPQAGGSVARESPKPASPAPAPDEPVHAVPHEPPSSNPRPSPGSSALARSGAPSESRAPIVVSVQPPRSQSTGPRFRAGTLPASKRTPGSGMLIALSIGGMVLIATAGYAIAMFLGLLR